MNLPPVLPVLENPDDSGAESAEEDTDYHECREGYSDYSSDEEVEYVDCMERIFNRLDVPEESYRNPVPECSPMHPYFVNITHKEYKKRFKDRRKTASRDKEKEGKVDEKKDESTQTVCRQCQLFRELTARSALPDPPDENQTRPLLVTPLLTVHPDAYVFPVFRWKCPCHNLPNGKDIPTYVRKRGGRIFRERAGTSLGVIARTAAQYSVTWCRKRPKMTYRL